MTPTTKKKKGCLWCGVVVILLLGSMILFTRSFFITGTLLPYLSRSTGMDISADRVRVGFSTLQAENLSLSGLEGIDDLEISRLEIAPVWKSILQGDIVIESVKVDRPRIRITISQSKPEIEEEDSSSPETTFALTIKNIELIDGTIEIYAGDRTALIRELSLTIPYLTPDSTLQVTTSMNLNVVTERSDIPSQSGVITADLNIPMNQRLLPTGVSGTLLIDLENPSEDTTPLTFRLQPDIHFRSEQGIIDVRGLSAIASDADSTLLELGIRDPFQVNLNGAYPVFTDTSIHLKVLKTELHRFPFSTLLPIESGTVEAELDLEIRDQAHQLESNLSLKLGELTGEFEGLSLNHHTVSLEIEASGSKEQFTFQQFQASILQGNKPVAKLEAKGTATLTGPSIEADLHSLYIDTSMLHSLNPALPQANGILTSEGRVSYDEKGVTRFRLSSSLTSGHLKSLHPFPSPVQSTLVGQRDPNQVLIRTGQFSWRTDSGGTESFRGKGSLDLNPNGLPEIQVQLEAGQLNLDSWLQVFAGEKNSKPTPALQPEAPSAVASLPSLPIGPSSVTLSAEGISVGSHRFQNLDLHVAAGKQSIVLHPFSFGLNGATFRTSSSVEWPEGIPEFTSWIRLSPIELEPIVDSLLPEKTGAVKGRFSLESDLSGKGLSFEPLAKTLKGSVKADISHGQIRLFAPVPGAPPGLIQTQKFIEEVIRTLAIALALPPAELLEPPIEKLSLDASIHDQLFSINSFLTENSQFRFRTSGSIPLGQGALGNSAVENLPVTLGLNTNLAKRIKVYREDRLEQEKISLPPLMDIKGTLADPKIDVRKRAIAGLLITGVNERNEIGNENVQRALGILGGLLSGEGPPPTPTPTPKAER